MTEARHCDECTKQTCDATDDFEELEQKIERVRGIVDRVAADPANVTDELWVYSIRRALDGG